MPDVLLKYITSSRYRERQTRVGYTYQYFFRVVIMCCKDRKAYVRLVDIGSLQACANHMVEFFDAGGKYDAREAASPELLCEDVIEAELNNYMAYYPDCTSMARLPSKLKGDTSLPNAKDPQVTIILKNDSEPQE